ncbi:MAG: PEP-CTERM sorting domain-containing protein [Akkermansiaceae bacterium]|nr:PEP-CTERM sorting domain-containing protein [Akkermansiaceae bacterium]
MKTTYTMLSIALATSISSHAALTMATRLDASLFTSAGAISTWEDSSFYTDSDHDATATGDPTVVLNALNSMPVVRFDGNDHFVINHTYTTGTAFIVTEYDFTIFPTGGSSEGLYGAATGFGAAQQYFTGAGNSTSWGNEGGSGFEDSKWLDGVQTHTGITNPADWHLNSGVDTTPNSFTSWKVGGDRGFNTGRAWTGDIAEVIVYEDALSDFDRRGVEMYLNDKWDLGITAYEAGSFNTNTAGLLLVVPEPSSTALLGLGLSSMLLRRRRS